MTLCSPGPALDPEAQINCQGKLLFATEFRQGLKQEQKDKGHFGKRAQGKRAGNPAARGLQPVFQRWELSPQPIPGLMREGWGRSTMQVPVQLAPEEDLAALAGNSHDYAQEEYNPRSFPENMGSCYCPLPTAYSPTPVDVYKPDQKAGRISGIFICRYSSNSRPWQR